MHFLLKTLSHVTWDAQAMQWSLSVDDPYLCSLIGGMYNEVFSLLLKYLPHFKPDSLKPK